MCVFFWFERRLKTLHTLAKILKFWRALSHQNQSRCWIQFYKQFRDRSIEKALAITSYYIL